MTATKIYTESLNTFPDFGVPVGSYDGALYQASCMAGGSADRGAVIYSTTNPLVASPETGELYLVFRADNNARFHLAPAEQWEEVGTFTRCGRAK